jgi:hypothetical protein
LVATSLGILLQLSVARSAPTRALTSSTDVVQSHLSISAHSTNPSGIDFVMRAILSNQLSYRIEVSSPRCLALKRQQLQDLDMVCVWGQWLLTMPVCHATVHCAAGRLLLQGFLAEKGTV